MGCFQQRQGVRSAPQATRIATENVVEANVPEVDAAAIRQRVAHLARERADAGRVLDTLSTDAGSSTLGFERARSLQAEHGLLRQPVRGNTPAPYDYYRDCKGTAHLDFSKTQDAAVRTERVNYQRIGPLGRVRNHTINQTVQTLSSEKVRLECDVSPTFAIHVAQHDTVFLNAAKQHGDKQIALSHEHEGALAVVLGKDQTLCGVTFDPAKGIATVTTDQGTITISGITNAKALQIGRDKGNGAAPAFVSIDGVASTVRSGRQENFQQDLALVKGALVKGGEIASKLGSDMLGIAQKVIAQTVPPPRSGGTEPPMERLSDDRIVPPVEMRPEVPPMPVPPPTPSPSDGKSEELVQMEAQLKKEAEHSREVEARLAEAQEAQQREAERTREVQARLERAEEAQRKNAEALATEEERAKLAELNLAVNELLYARGETPAKRGEFTDIRASLLNVTQSVRERGAQEIATALLDARKVKRAEVAKNVGESMGSLSEKPSLSETKEWADKNMALYGTLDDHGKRALVDVIKNKWKFGVGLENVKPQDFFNSHLALVASEEIRRATRTETVYRPPSSRPGPYVPLNYTVPDIGEISSVIRLVEDNPQVLRLLEETDGYKETRAALPTKGFWNQEPGLEQRSLDARVRGRKDLAEALLIRSFVEGGRTTTSTHRETIRKALGDDYQFRFQIVDRYQEEFRSNISSDLKLYEPTVAGSR